jgi:DNA-directed RNA polymerase sigma subunit (sigma70/sigma32)
MASPTCRTPVAQASTRQTLDLMRESLRPLTVAGKEGEMTFAEIGQQLGISAVRARALYLKGMNKLRREMVDGKVA